MGHQMRVLRVFSMRVEKENLICDRSQDGNSTRIISWRLKGPVGGVALLDRLPTQASLLGGCPDNLGVACLSQTSCGAFLEPETGVKQPKTFYYHI